MGVDDVLGIQDKEKCVFKDNFVFSASSWDGRREGRGQVLWLRAS